jgi:hypothetical protein
MDSGQLTSVLMWRVTLITALIDVPLLILAARWVSPDHFRKLKWYLVGAAVLVYAALWGTFGSVFFWDAAYKAIFPVWSRWLLPLGFGLLYGALALAFWRVSLLAARRQVVWFILQGGMMSLVGHSIGISRGLFRVPMLVETSVVSAFAFGVFEFIFYWSAIVGISVAVRWLSLRLRQVNG